MDWEDEVLKTAAMYFEESLELAMTTNDEELFQKIVRAANEIVVNETVSGLIEKGFVEISGLDETGEFYFQLTDEGKRVMEAIYEPHRESPGTE